MLALLLIAAAPSWTQTFSPDAVASHVSGSSLRVVVVTAGSDSQDARAATAAFEAALKATKKTRVVVSSASLGKFTDMDDERIVKKVEKLPLDVIVTVRSFESDEGATVIVTLYDKAGEVLSAFSAEKGKKIAARSETAPVETSKASKTIAGVIGESGGAKAQKPAGSISVGSAPQFEAPVETGNEAFDTKYVAFETWLGINGYGQVVTSWSTPYQGKYRRQLTNVEFYEIVERKDLADRYRAKQRLRIGLGVGGGLGGFLGGMAMIVGGIVAPKTVCTRYSRPYSASDIPRCEAYDNSALVGLAISGSIVSLAGIVMGMTAMFINPHPVKPHEAYELADGYNKRLKARTIDAGVDVSATGASIRLGGTF